MENWKQIKGFENYSISNFGRVKNKHGNIMKSRLNSRGYCIIGLRKTGEKQKIFSIHRLVATHFIENKNAKEYVNHMDGDKSNNNVQNLEWVTQSENQLHAYSNGLQMITSKQIERLKKYSEKRKKPIRVINEMLGINEVFESLKDASKNMNCNEKTLRNCITKRNKSRLGYIVEYIGGDDLLD